MTPPPPLFCFARPMAMLLAKMALVIPRFNVLPGPLLPPFSPTSNWGEVAPVSVIALVLARNSVPEVRAAPATPTNSRAPVNVKVSRLIMFKVTVPLVLGSARPTFTLALPLFTVSRPPVPEMVVSGEAAVASAVPMPTVRPPVPVRVNVPPFAIRVF